MTASSIAALPRSFQELLIHFSVCFGCHDGRFTNFITAVVGWILCTGTRTISNVLRTLGPEMLEKHHSTLYDFFARARWQPDFLSEQLFLLLRPWLPDIVHVVLDDTLCKKTGPHIWGAGMHHDAVRSSYGRFGATARKVAFSFGHNFVVLALWIPFPWNSHAGVAIPLLFRLYRTHKLAPEGEYRKRTELAADLVQILYGWCEEFGIEERLVVLADQEYVCTTILSALPEDVNLVGSFSMQAAIFERPPPRRPGQRGAPRKKGDRLPTPEKLSDDPSVPWKNIKVRMYGKLVSIKVKVINCLWYGVTKSKVVRIVITRDPSGFMDDRAYLCTDPRCPPTAILQRYSRRWCIECTFRICKQLLGLEDPQNGWWHAPAGSERPKKEPGANPKGDHGRLAVERTAPMIFVIFALVHLWYFGAGNPKADVQRARERAPWHRHKAAPSFTDMLGALRREILRERLMSMPLLARVCEKFEEVAGGLIWGA